MSDARPSWSARIGAAVRLASLFGGQVVLSGFSTAWLILRPGRRPESGLVRVPFENLDETGAAILGALITLTPGSTTLDVDLEKQEFLIHLLDTSRAEAVASKIHRTLERPLQALLPAREAR